MAVDSKAKRKAALNFGSIYPLVFPTPDGTISADDRGQLLGSYIGLIAESQRQRVREALDYQLSQITTANGYNIDLGDRYLEKADWERVVNTPAVNIVWSRETYLNADPGSHTMGYLIKKARVFLDFMTRNVNDIDELRNKILADVENRLMNYWYLPSTTNAHTALNTMIVDNNIWGFDGTKDWGGITIQIEIEYKQNLYNPYSIVAGTPDAQDPDIPGSVPISMREIMRNAYIYNIQQMITSNGYNYTWHTNPKGKIVDPDHMIERPWANVTEPFELYDNFGDPGMQDRLIRKTFDTTIDCYSSNVNNPVREREDMIADFEQRFLTKFYFPDSDGKRNAFSGMFTYNEPFAIQANKPMVGVTIGHRLWYHQDMYDPTSI